jgi:hypothetical protein
MNRAATLIAAITIASLTSALPASAGEETVAAPSTRVAAAQVAAQMRLANALSRPKLLPALYVSYAALQAFDVFSTRQALSQGAREANPLMKNVAGNTGAMVAVKAGVALGTIVAAERLWKTNRTAAIAVMVASNSVAAIVAARNARTLRQLP